MYEYSGAYIDCRWAQFPTSIERPKNPGNTLDSVCYYYEFDCHSHTAAIHSIYRYTGIHGFLSFAIFFLFLFFLFLFFSFFCLASPPLFLLFRRDTTYILFSFLFSLTPLLDLAYFLQFSCFRFHASTPPPLPPPPLPSSAVPALRVGN